jgi:hypothetical protein
VDHCCSPVFNGVPVGQSVDLCSVLWTIVVHLVFIGVPVGQCVDLCGVLWTIVVHPCLLGFQLLNLLMCV